jgi:hypothetical protein
LEPDILAHWHRAHGIEEHPRGIWQKDQALVIVGNDDLKRGVTHLFHNSQTAGHPRITKTTELIGQYYWWPEMQDFITHYVQGCTMCQMSKVNTYLMKPNLSPITPIKNTVPFQTIALDFIVKLPESQGHDSILTITDHNCSKVSIFIPCNETIDAIGTAALYAQWVFLHYGVPQKVISDRDPHFTAMFTKELCQMLGIKQNISMAYHPQTDGQSEHTNQSLEQYLRLYCRTQQEQWAQWMPVTQYTWNSWPSSTTKKTPFELLIRYTPQAHQLTRTSSLPTVQE